MNIPTKRAVTRVRYETRRRKLLVTAVEQSSPSFISVTLTGDELADFTSASFDDHVKFMLETGDGQLIMRDFTPRRFNTANRELTLEFALHPHGPASDWARTAQPGMHAIVGGPRGSMIIPKDYDWHLLLGDLSALPAIHRRLEELPAATAAHVIAYVADPADARAFASAAELSVSWVHTPNELLSAVRDLALPQGDGYVWCAGEASTMTSLRDILQHEKGVAKDAMRVSAYWKQDSENCHENL
jgi:NADPH-dependent ferric siderophore reductase